MVKAPFLASSTPESALGREAGPICGGEAGRHLAILGSCAAALANARPGKHYYLATEALLQRELSPDDWPIPGEPMLALASCSHVGKREAKANAVMEARVGDGTRLAEVYTLHVRYNVVGEDVFLRLFRGRNSATPRSADNPYATIATPALSVRTPTHAESELELVTPALCPGHFDGYPALPVAVVMQKLSGMATELLANHPEFRVPRCVVQTAKVAASNLAWAGDSVRYEMTFVERQGDDFLFHGGAQTAEGVDVGTMELGLRGVR